MCVLWVVVGFGAPSQNESGIIDIQFLHGFDLPTICVLYHDGEDNRHVKTYEIDLRERKISTGPWNHPNVDSTATMLIPVPRPSGVRGVDGATWFWPWWWWWCVLFLLWKGGVVVGACRGGVGWRWDDRQAAALASQQLVAAFWNVRLSEWEAHVTCSVCLWPTFNPLWLCWCVCGVCAGRVC